MKSLAFLLFTILLGGCATQTYLVNQEVASAKPSFEDRQDFFIEGIGQDETLDAAKVCNGSQNVIKVESELTFVDGFLSVITAGIYTPRTARVYCKKA